MLYLNILCSKPHIHCEHESARSDFSFLMGLKMSVTCWRVVEAIFSIFHIVWNYFVIFKSIALWSAFLHTSNIYYLNNLLACKYEGISFHCVNRCFLFIVISHYCLSKTFRCKSMKQTFTDRINITVTGVHFIPHK